MHFYPAYRLQDVLDEYAVRFFAMLNEAYRLRSGDYRMLAFIGRLANAEKGDFDKAIQQLEWAAMHPSDILKTDGNGSSAADIKKVLG